MYEFEVSIEIDVPPRRVWRALCDPAEVVQWDAGVVAALNAPPNYPQAGQHVRWRNRSGLFRTLHDRPQDVVPERRLRSILTVGPIHIDETYTLAARNGGCQLTAALHVVVRLPFRGRLIERRYIGPRSRDAVGASLVGLKRHCETHP